MDIGIVLQLGVVIILLFLLVKKLPALCNGLLSGNPSLSGGDVAGTLTKAVGVAAAAVVTGGAGAVAGAAGATGGMASKLMGGIKGGMGAMGRGAMNYALTQNPLGQSFAQGMNLFSGNGQNLGLMQKGGLSQALGLNTGQGDNKQGLVDRMKNDSGDKSKDGEKKGGSSSDNNNQNQNQNTPAATGKDGGKETIEKQIGEVNKQLDRIEKILNGGGGNGGTNPSGNSGNVNLPGLAGLVNRFTSGSSGTSYQKDDNASSQGGFTLAKATNGKGQTIPIYVPNSAPDNGSIPQHTNLTHSAPTGKHWSGKPKK